MMFLVEVLNTCFETCLLMASDTQITPSTLGCIAFKYEAMS